MFRNISLLRFLVWLEVGAAGRRIFTKIHNKVLGYVWLREKYHQTKQRQYNLQL